MEDTIQELEARVAVLEAQKGALQNKLGLAKQHIMDLGGRTPYRSNKGMDRVGFPRNCGVDPQNGVFRFLHLSGKSVDLEGGMRRATHTAPPRYGPVTEDPRTELERYGFRFAENRKG